MSHYDECMKDIVWLPVYMVGCDGLGEVVPWLQELYRDVMEADEEASKIAVDLFKDFEDKEILEYLEKTFDSKKFL